MIKIVKFLVKDLFLWLFLRFIELFIVMLLNLFFKLLRYDKLFVLFVYFCINEGFFELIFKVMNLFFILIFLKFLGV